MSFTHFEDRGEVVDALKKGEDFDFTYAEFPPGLDLSGLDFSGLDLTEASFFQADLRRAKFDGATLLRTNFIGANLTGATFHEANDVERHEFSPDVWPHVERSVQGGTPIPEDLRAIA